ncbi:hypothetical protein ACIQUM_01840 [Amycolatopsis azurea]|uniref:hypothetical protein n=1 Tax=Amycolatopsis azurea TaxID=36819 RepID=UPI0038055079
MNVLIPLVGVVIGGLLVLAGDSIRRRAEWRRLQAQRLLDAGIEIIAVNNRVLGDLLEAREQGQALVRVHAASGMRREAAARFFALPGSEGLRPQFDALVKAHARLRQAVTAKEKEWADLHGQYETSILAFVVELRRIVRRGKVPPEPAPSHVVVMEASSPLLPTHIFVSDS